MSSEPHGEETIIDATDKIRPTDPNVLQRRASDPAASVWVGASAGSGKTKVLTDRVLRLMLPRADGMLGTPVYKILCLTFTKAAATEMALRLNEILSAWAVMDEVAMQDPKNTKSLVFLLGRPARDDELLAARQLFASVVDSPGGLKIMTIHSFAQSLLARFPLEAGMSPGMEVMDEAQADTMLKNACREIARRAFEDSGSPLSVSFHALLQEQNEDQMFNLMKQVTSERHQISMMLNRFGTIEELYVSLCKGLDIPAQETQESAVQDFCAQDRFNRNALHAAAEIMHGDKSKRMQANAAKIFAWLECDHAGRVRGFDLYKTAFLTSMETIKSDSHLFTQKLSKAAPDAYDAIQEEARRVHRFVEMLKTLKMARLTRDLLVMAQAILQSYQAAKEAHGTLDYDDLVIRARDLIVKAPAWVLYKMDQGLEHILVDEAQDTNPEQWEMIATLCQEFYQHAPDGEKTRTVFIVGDEKQSIYSFQRAAPEEFTRMKSHFAQKFQDHKHRWDEVPINISFRSTRAVLDMVDSVFAGDDVRAGVAQASIRHESFRRRQGGCVELWPLFENDPSPEEDNPLAPPITVRSIQSGSSKLAEHIADQIESWIDREDLPSRGRTVRAGDIMILVRSRSALVHQITRALKLRNIPVNGSDRMNIREELCVMDLVALADFALCPSDDLTLAALLKSPLVGLSEEELFDLCHGRSGSLWENIRDQNPQLAEYFRVFIRRAGHQKPYDFFRSALNDPCPGDDRSGIRAMMGRLGADIADPLDEFLALCLDVENNEIPSLQLFLQEFRATQSTIKRELEEAGNNVRIMTVHSAKGLQAPIVILPDTTSAPQTQKMERILWPQKTGLAYPLFCPRSSEAPQAYASAFDMMKARQQEEYKRLLYVAMTRAEERLYIAGYTKSKTKIYDSWYDYCARGMRISENLHEIGEILRTEDPQLADPDRLDKAGVQSERTRESAPDWLFAKAPEEPVPPRPLTPSRLDDDQEERATSPLSGTDTYRFRRGNVTHKLLEFLPDMPPAQRGDIARKFLERHAQDLSDIIRGSIADEVIALMHNPDFEQFFSASAVAEAPITGLMPDGRIIAGQIDRLLIAERDIWILDYKSNRPSPDDPADIPQIYRDQMQLYRDVLMQIYPDYTIHCALLWTDKAKMMVIS